MILSSRYPRDSSNIDLQLDPYLLKLGNMFIMQFMILSVSLSSFYFIA